MAIKLIVDSRRYRISKRKMDAWAKRWLNNPKLKWPRRFRTVDETDEHKIGCLRRGAGVLFEIFDEDTGKMVVQHGVVIKRRNQLLRIKSEDNQIYEIFILASRKDWSVYRKKIIAINLIKMERRIAQCRPEVQTVAQKCRRAYEYGTQSESVVNSDKSFWFDHYQLNAEEKMLINRYVNILREWNPIYKGSR